MIQNLEKIGVVGELVKRVEMGDPKARKIDEQGRDGWYESWRIDEQDPVERTKSRKKVREIGKRYMKFE